MQLLQDALAYELIRNAVVVAALSSLLCALVGTLVVVKRLVFISGGISHATFGGLGAAHWAGLDPRLGGAAAAMLAALALAGQGRGRGRSHDAMIGVLWAAGMALGVLFLAHTPGYAPDLVSYLFGNVLGVRRIDVYLTLGLVAVVVLLFVAFYKELVAVAFDERYAAVQGVPVRRVSLAIMLAVALSVVFLVQLVGIILVIALLTIPPLVGLRLVHGFLGVVTVATVYGLLMTLGGLAVSYAYDLPSGPAIAVLGVAGLWTVDAGLRLVTWARPGRRA